MLYSCQWLKIPLPSWFFYFILFLKKRGIVQETFSTQEKMAQSNIILLPLWDAACPKILDVENWRGISSNHGNIYGWQRDSCFQFIYKNSVLHKQCLSINQHITKSWSVAFNVATLPLSHVSSHVIINFFLIFYTIF